MTLDKFISTYKVGESYDYNNTGYKGECVSLIKLYIKNVLGKTPQSIGNAKEYWNKRSLSYLRSIFTPYTNTASYVPQRGDVFVRTSGTYGHVGIVLSATTSEFYAIEQNFNGSKKVQKITHTSWTSTNFLRPKVQTNITHSFKPGSTYTVKVDKLNVRNGAGTGYGKVAKAKLTSSLQATAYSNGQLKIGAKIKVCGTKQNGNNIWVKTSCGWVAAYYNSKNYIG